MSTDGGVDNQVDKGVRILSLDSGGPGTYSQLLIIKEYMVRLANDLGIEEADVYPANYFDLMGGVGFGGLVAILLGHLRMNVDEAIEALLDVALAIFPDNARPNSDLETNSRQLRESVENILQTRGILADRKMQEKGEEPSGCKVALYAATTVNLSHPVILRTYKSRGSSLNPTIVEAICATMAIPSYFSPIKIGPRGRQQTFIGGPRGARNPTRELLKEASGIFGKGKLVVQIVSLGCGRSHVSSMGLYASTEGVDPLVQELAEDCETVDGELSMRLCNMDAYMRVNVDRGMENLPMNEWHDLGPIESHTNAYVESAAISETLDASLRHLQEGAGAITLGEINHPSTAKDVQYKLEKHKEDLDRVIKSVRDIAEESHLLERLKPVDAPSYHEDHSCMEGTRTAILDEIVAWAAKPFDGEKKSNHITSNVLWLYGMPGLGKTSVANSLCDYLRKSGNLGGSFFCKHDNADLREPKRVLSTLVAKLVRMWGPFRILVAKVLLDEPQINPESTRGEILLKPLQALTEHPPHPLILVIDAIDECGQPGQRGQLLNCLTEACSLVNWLKVVVTSRPEPDIKSFFDRHGVFGRDLATDDPESKDIRLFTERRMSLVAIGRHLSPDWPGTGRISQIVERSRGLFIFVDTLSRLVDVPKPEPLLVQMLDGNPEEANAELHKLYSTVITSRAVGHIEDLQSILRAVVAVSACRPLCAEALSKLIDLDVPTILSWLDELSSLLYQDVAAQNVIRVRHLSVLEFLVGSTCPPRFRVDEKLANSELTRCCLVTMVNELHFNICGLETSCLSNADIPDLNDRVRQRIPDALQYSCMHWSTHLCYDVDPVSMETTKLLDDFFAEAHLLYWIEVLSLMGKVSVAISALRVVKAHFKKFKDHHQRLVEDALHFLLAFFTPISTSAPHIYVSALPFMPTGSDVRKRARVLFPGIIDVCKGRVESWPAPSSIWLGHTGGICCATYSPDGLSVASGSYDTTIRVWDAQTGAAVGQPLTGHNEAVLSTAYSPDGRNIVSGSDDHTIRIWDAQTGAAVGRPLTGHTEPVRSVAYSPDGWNVASGSDDHTIRIWDVQTEAVVGEPLKGHRDVVRSVAYSPDGRNIVSASDDQMIRIWDVQTGAAVGQPLIGHHGRVFCAAYSPDGRNVVSGSEDKTVRIWDVQTGAVVGQPLTGHTAWVYSVAYSPDGKRIASGSYDKTIRIWDAQTGASVGQRFTGHTAFVRCVAYSPDSQNIASGSFDKTIRIWDAQTGTTVGKPLIGHRGGILSVAYSSDGRDIISGSSENTIEIWDAQTGAVVGQPLTGHTNYVLSVAYVLDGQNVVSGSNDHTIRIWDARNGAAVGQPLTGHVGGVQSVAYSPDSRNVASGSDDHTIRIWDVQTGAAVGGPLKGHRDVVRSVAYSPDGQNIASASDDETIRIWNVQTGEAVGQPFRGHTGGVLSVAYSPDGRNFVSGSNDKTIRIWDAQAEAVVGEPLIGHTGWVRSVAYSPDGRNVVSGSDDHTIRIWDAQTRAAVGQPLRGHIGGVMSVAYSPDGGNVVSGSNDGTIRIWDVQPVMDEDNRSLVSHSSHPSTNDLSLTAFSGRPIPITRLDSDGWVRCAEGLLLWVPEDCRNGLTCPAILTIPHTGRQRLVRIDFTRFQYGSSWTNIRGGIWPESYSSIPSL